MKPMICYKRERGLAAPLVHKEYKKSISGENPLKEIVYYSAKIEKAPLPMAKYSEFGYLNTQFMKDEARINIYGVKMPPNIKSYFKDKYQYNSYGSTGIDGRLDKNFLYYLVKYVFEHRDEKYLLPDLKMVQACEENKIENPHKNVINFSWSFSDSEALEFDNVIALSLSSNARWLVYKLYCLMVYCQKKKLKTVQLKMNDSGEAKLVFNF